jgi:hypothetical protein
MRFTAIALLSLFTFSAEAADVGSAYTKLEDAGCRTVAEYEAGATSYCKGFRDVWFRIDDGDARISVTYGIDPDAPPEQDRRWESFQSFNNINNVVEWRYSENVNGGRPFAAILRWLISFPNNDDGGATHKQGQVLVVSRIADESGPGCFVGYVDALVNRNANQMARDVADTMAADFNCGVDEPVFHGETGRLSGRPMRPPSE